MTTQAKGRGRFEDTTLLILKMKKWLRAMMIVLEAGNHKETDFSLETPKVVQFSLF